MHNMQFMATGLILGRFDCILTRAVTFVPRREIQLEKIFLGFVQGRYLHIFLVFLRTVDIHSSHERKSKLVLDSGFHVVNCGFQVLDPSLCQ